MKLLIALALFSLCASGTPPRITGVTPSVARSGEILTIRGESFGPEGDFNKVLFGNLRAVERDLPMYRGDIRLLQRQFYETTELVSEWKKDLLSWNDTEIVVRVPRTAHAGPLVLSKQSRIGWVPRIDNLLLPFLMKDPLTERVEGNFPHRFEGISYLAPAEVAKSATKRTSGRTRTRTCSPSRKWARTSAPPSFRCSRNRSGLRSCAICIGWRRAGCCTTGT